MLPPVAGGMWAKCGSTFASLDSMVRIEGESRRNGLACAKPGTERISTKSGIIAPEARVAGFFLTSSKAPRRMWSLARTLHSI